jgi:hypothetical protein
MGLTYQDEEIPFPLLRRREVRRRDRMRAAPSGALTGVLAGIAALGIVHALAPEALARPVRDAAGQWGVSASLSLVVAYGTAGALGALVGAAFASVTRYLRRWLPLAVWAIVFFVSLTLLILAISRSFGWALPNVVTVAALAASAAYAVVVSLALPLRKPRTAVP